jgi:hypothetical protein
MFREPFEACLPSGAGAAACLIRRESFMPQRDARSAIESFQVIRDRRGCARRPNPLPGVDQSRRRIDFDELTFQDVGLTPDDARSTPAATLAKVARPLPGVEHARPDPPVDDLLRGQRLEIGQGPISPLYPSDRSVPWN